MPRGGNFTTDNPSALAASSRRLQWASNIERHEERRQERQAATAAANAGRPSAAENEIDEAYATGERIAARVACTRSGAPPAAAGR